MVEMDMNYPSDAVDAIMAHRYQGLDATSASMSNYGAALQRQTKYNQRAPQPCSQGAAEVMLKHRYGGS